MFETNSDLPIGHPKITFLHKTTDISPSFPKKIFAAHRRNF